MSGKIPKGKATKKELGVLEAFLRVKALNSKKKKDLLEFADKIKKYSARQGKGGREVIAPVFITLKERTLWGRIKYIIRHWDFYGRVNWRWTWFALRGIPRKLTIKEKQGRVKR